MLGTLLLRNEIGMSLHVNVASVDDAYATMRHYGAQGWISGDPISRVLEFPLAMADRFDWSLVGAREFTMTDKESGEVIRCVEYRGEVYKRRELPEQRIKGGKVLPPAVKFSRGAHGDDPPEIVESATGDSKGYVSLAIFRGTAPVVEAFCKPKAGAAQPPSEPSDRPSPLVAALSELNDIERKTIGDMARQQGFTSPKLLALIREIGGAEVFPRAKFRALMDALRKGAAA